MKKQLYNHKAEQKLADIINDVRSHIQMSMPPEFFRETIASLKEDLFSSQGLYVGDKELKQAIDTFNGFPSAGFAQNCPAMAFRIAELLFLANQQGVLYQPMLVHPAEIGITSLLKLHPVIQVMKEQFPHRKITYNLFEPGYSLSKYPDFLTSILE